jgi:lipopolysaccharide export system protein LptA
LALQLNPIIASGLVTLALQSALSAGRAAPNSEVDLVAQAPIAIPLQNNKGPQAHPAQSKQPDPIKVSPVQVHPGSEEGKPRMLTPTTGLVTIESDLQQADNTTGIVTATGNVRIVYPDQRVVATARQAQYYSKEGRVVLSGDVDVIQADGHAIKAERVIYDVNRERITAEPPIGGQVYSRYRMTSPTSGTDAPTAGTGVPKTGAGGPIP